HAMSARQTATPSSSVRLPAPTASSSSPAACGRSFSDDEGAGPGGQRPPGRRTSMLHAIFIAGLLLQPVPGLRARALPTTVHVPASTIVGRSVCGDTAWLLTDWPELISVSIPQRTTVVREVAGIKASDQPWGLACLTDASLWTLVNPRTLARLTPGGVVQER